jgi:hypothetical protein
MFGHSRSLLSVSATVLVMGALLTGAWSTSGNSFGDNHLKTPHRTVSVLAAIAAAVVAAKVPPVRTMAVAGIAVSVAAGGAMEAKAFLGIAGVLHAVAGSILVSATASGVLLSTVPADVGTVTDSGSPSLKVLARVTWISLLVQTALGAMYRHQVVGLLPHVACAMLVMGMVMFAGIAAWSTEDAPKPLTRTALTMLILTSVQYKSGPRDADGVVIWSVIHVAVGAITTATCALMEIQISRYVRPAVVAA